MAGTVDPIGGVQGFVARLQGLIERVTNLEGWQRQVVTMGPGVITQWGGSTPPPGALRCNGATFSAAQYPQLFAVLGSTTLPNIAGTPMFVIWT
jgi:hypothetical protein